VKQTAPTTIADVRYGYDAAGNIAKISDLTSGDHQCFRNDHLRRLTEAWTPASGDCGPAPTAGALGGPAGYWQSYTYDVLGNRKTLVEHATAAGDRTTTYTVPDGRHLMTAASTVDNTGTRTGGFTYDPVGNMLTRPAGAAGTQTMTWDAEGHLATSTDSTGTTSFVYDADGGRLIRQDPAGRTLYLPGQELRYAANGGVSTGTRYYSHAGQPIAGRSGAGLTWFSGDAQGTVQISVSALNQTVSTRRQTPFGAARNGTGVWPSTMDKGFVGGTNDNTGLVHLGSREYDPSTGRFVSRDPVVNTSDPQQMNGYAYSGNAPVTTSDPSGKLGSASCPPGFVGGPGACTGNENPPPPEVSGPPVGYGPCDAKHSASNCDNQDSPVNTGYKGPCDAQHSASNCEGPPQNPWDVVSTTWYSNGTRLVVYRNGKMSINGFLLPDGVIDADALARKIDRDRKRDDEPDDVYVTMGKIMQFCNPQICTLGFKNAIDSLHAKMIDEMPGYGGMGICINGNAFYGWGFGVEGCIYFSHGAMYLTDGTHAGAGYDVSVNANLSTLYVQDMAEMCGPFRYGTIGVGPVSTGALLSSDGGKLQASSIGVGAGTTKPVSGSVGFSNTMHVWQFGNGQYGKNICS
jgi:RHS repeat-associated protein